ncbi:immunity-related GTPase family M protein 3 [Sardina pilchardus]|uniref:immunity-related GTPase family M protein 3 n=1 Tax=Sardina pilchardus TaxID=27697 RepID=UPI002E0DC354
MQGKLSEEHTKHVLGAWRTAPPVAELQDQLLAVLELYEHFPLDVAITGGTPEANARLARVVCGLQDQEHCLLDEEEEEGEDEEEDESDEGEEELEQSEMSDVDTGSKEMSKNVWRTENGLPVLSYPYIPNVRIWILNGPSAPYSGSPPSAGSLFDLLVVLTSELHPEDHMVSLMELRERDQPLYLVKAEADTDLVHEELKGPCKTCAWERMRERKLELQRRRKEREATGTGVSQDPDRLVGMTEIGGLLLSALPDMRKQAFCQFILDASKELRAPKNLRNNAKSTISPALDTGKVKKEEIEQISAFLSSKALTNHPARLLSILNAMEDFRLDVGVLGATGCGSSSFINALLGLKNGEEGAAPTGVTETTLEPVAYQYPEFLNVVLWDLPGMGRVGGLNSPFLQKSSEADPLTTVLRPSCDVYILLSPVRLSMDCVSLLHHILATGTQCYLVLSKADQVDEERVSEVKRWSEEVLSTLGYQLVVYAVCALQPERMDFHELTETLQLSISCHKRKAMAQHVAKLLEQEIFKKKTELCKTM